MPRTTPYTQLGIRRIACSRCGTKPSFSSWQVCTDDRVFRPLCRTCDVLLNELVLRWVGDPDTEAKIAAYQSKTEVRAS